MSRKRAISLLLVLSMVFSLNTVVFAESVAGYNEEVGAEAQVSENSISENSRSSNLISGFNGKDDMAVSYCTSAYYTGKKIKASDLNITVSVNGYIVDAKSIKIEGNNKNTSTSNIFKIKSIDTNYKNIKYADSVRYSSSLSLNAGKNVYDTRESEEAGKRAAKAALKAVKKDFNTYLKKSEKNSFSFDICATYINNYVTYKSVKSLKISGNSYAFNTYVDDGSWPLNNTAVIKISNSGKIQGVYILVKGTKRTNGTYTVKKIKLKKNTDYTINNSIISFDGINVNCKNAYDLTKLGASSGQST